MTATEARPTTTETAAEKAEQKRLAQAAEAKVSRPSKNGSAPGAGTKPATRIIVTAILTLVALYFLVPVYYIVVAATKTTADLFSTNGSCSRT